MAECNDSHPVPCVVGFDRAVNTARCAKELWLVLKSNAYADMIRNRLQSSQLGVCSRTKSSQIRVLGPASDHLPLQLGFQASHCHFAAWSLNIGSVASQNRPGTPGDPYDVAGLLTESNSTQSSAGTRSFSDPHQVGRAKSKSVPNPSWRSVVFQEPNECCIVQAA
jgi:hypothetical protein